MTPPLPLADGMPRSTEADWRAAVVERRGRTPDALQSRSDDGVTIGPIYPRDSAGQVIAGRQPGDSWRIVQRLGGGDPAAAAAECRDALTGGATGVAVVFEASAHPLAGGFAPASAGDLAGTLGEVISGGSSLRLDGGVATAALADPFLEPAARKGWQVSLAFDPIAALAAGSPSSVGLEGSGAAIAAMARSFDEREIEGAVAVADGRLWHAAGASEVQELAVALATFVWLLRRLDAEGLAIERAAARLGVELAADADQFLTVAKFRAMRLLLAHVFEACGVPTPAMDVHAETAWRMMSRRDPYSNVIRATAAAFSAGVGGANSITVLPHDAIAGSGNGAGQRLARNAQTILIEEAHIARVADPAAGSGAIEALTAELAEAAWERFRTIEAAGGIAAAVASGALQEEVAATREARLRKVRDGTRKIIGIGNNTVSGNAASATGDALVFSRLAEVLEQIEAEPS